MTERTDIVDLANEIADIARQTSDPDTGRLLMDLVHRLWTEAGLGSDETSGGGDLPGEPLMEPVREVA
jgi:hypothetical protein